MFTAPYSGVAPLLGTANTGGYRRYQHFWLIPVAGVGLMWVHSHLLTGPPGHLGKQQVFLDVIEFKLSGISRKSPTMAGGLRALPLCT